MENKKNKITPFGKQVKKKLIDRNMTQKELAELVGTSYKYLNRIIYGERTGKKYMHDIKKVLDIKEK